MSGRKAGRMMKEENNRSSNIWLDGIMGVVVGDALGCPVEFMSRKNYGTESISDGWLKILARRSWIENMCARAQEMR